MGYPAVLTCVNPPVGWLTQVSIANPAMLSRDDIVCGRRES